MAIVLTNQEVLDETAGLMPYRLRARGFSAGRGGTETAGFTVDTTPTLARAMVVTSRNGRIASDDFPGAVEGDRAELVTVAALRSAIELENGVVDRDGDRIDDWREQLREYVGRFSDSGSGGEEPGGVDMPPVWDFPPLCGDHIPGSEVPYCWPYPLKHDVIDA